MKMMHVEAERGKDVCLAFYYKNGKKSWQKLYIFYQELTSEPCRQTQFLNRGYRARQPHAGVNFITPVKAYELGLWSQKPCLKIFSLFEKYYSSNSYSKGENFQSLALHFGLHAVYFVILLLDKDDLWKLLSSNVVLWAGCDVWVSWLDRHWQWHCFLQEKLIQARQRLLTSVSMSPDIFLYAK